MDMDIDTAYNVLDLEPPASEREVKEAYRTLTREYHPDVSSGETREYWIQVKKAKETLIKNGYAGSKRTNQSTEAGETQKNNESTASKAKGSATDRSYQRSQRNRTERTTQQDTTEQTQSTQKDTTSKTAFSIGDIHAGLVGEEVQVEGVLADVRIAPGEGVEATLVSPANLTETITVYLWSDNTERSTATLWKKYRVTGTLHDSQESDGLEIHIYDGDEFSRLYTGQKWNDIRDKYGVHKESETDNTTQNTTSTAGTTSSSEQTSSQNRQSGRASRIRSGLSSTALVVAGLLLLPGIAVNNRVGPVWQIGIILGIILFMPSGIFYGMSDLIFLASLFVFSIGGMFAFGITSSYYLYVGETLIGLGFLFALFLTILYYWLCILGEE